MVGNDKSITLHPQSVHTYAMNNKKKHPGSKSIVVLLCHYCY